MTSKQTIAIVGSRDIERETAYSLFEQHLSSFLSQGRIWLLGGSRGLDQWALEWLLEQNETCWIVVPYTRASQPRWLHPWLDEVERVVELRLPKRKSASAIRNRHMVDLAQTVFGFWSGQGGLTVKTLKNAIRNRREVHAIPVFSDSEKVSSVQNRER
ncbi:MAG TPA: DNA-processing protein DprA [Pyrinomonadaceae bacterium]|nr:DNA-processing protein DprA [Pyrinomonadaceae bacterium]